MSAPVLAISGNIVVRGRVPYIEDERMYFSLKSRLAKAEGDTAAEANPAVVVVKNRLRFIKSFTGISRLVKRSVCFLLIFGDLSEAGSLV